MNQNLAEQHMYFLLIFEAVDGTVGTTFPLRAGQEYLGSVSNGIGCIHAIDLGDHNTLGWYQKLVLAGSKVNYCIVPAEV